MDFCYNADDWEVTHPWEDRADLLQSMAPGDFMELGLLRALPTKFMVCTLDDDGSFGEAFFDTKVEAEAEAARQRERFNADA